MMRLIRSEVKKIYKSKMNIVLLLLLFSYAGWQTYDVYHKEVDRFYNETLEVAFRDVDGKEIGKGLDYYRFADKLQHQYKGRWNDATVHRLVEDVLEIENRFPRKTIDEAHMTRVYGEDYQTFMEDASQGKYSIQELTDKLMAIGNKTVSWEEDDSYEDIEENRSAKVNAYFTNVYIEDSVWALYENAYIGMYQAPSLKDEKAKEEHVRLLQWEKTWKKNLPFEKMEEDSLYISAIGTSKKDAVKSDYKDEAAWYAKKYQTSPQAYDSVVGNTLFVKALSNINILSLMAIAILLANTFAMEVSNKTDQLMVPTKVGNRKITIAKLSAGILTAVGIIVVQVVMIFIMSCIFLPMRDIGMQYFSQSGVSLNEISEWMYSYKEIIINALLLMSLAATGTATLTLTLSYVSKNRFFVIIPMLLFLIAGLALASVFQQFFPTAVIAQFLPSQMIMFQQFFGFVLLEFRQFVSVIHVQGTIIAWKDIIMWSWSILIVLMMAGVILHAKQHTVKNK